jgi:hypothetical protein
VTYEREEVLRALSRKLDVAGDHMKAARHAADRGDLLACRLHLTAAHATLGAVANALRGNTVPDNVTPFRGARPSDATIEANDLNRTRDPELPDAG